MLTHWKREREIRQVLARLARQRVAIAGNIWVVENALQRDDRTEAALATCLMRGWVEILHKDMPTAKLDPSNLPLQPPPFTHTESTYRMTDSGWAALNRAHAWAVCGVIVAILSIILPVLIAASIHQRSPSSGSKSLETRALKR